MNTRLATIHGRKQYTADEVITEEIKIVDPISSIIITAEPDNNPSGSNATAHPVKCITKVEIVDGSDVLFSLTGQEAQGVDWYDHEIQRPNIMCYLNGMYSEMIIPVHFGRYLFDPELALVPARFRNPEIRVTVDVDGGGDEANDVYVTILAHIFDQKQINPVGFLMTKEVKDFTLVASSHEYTKLPRDYPYRQLFVRPQTYGQGPEYQIDNLKLSEENDKRIPLNHTMFQILRNIMGEWATYQEWILVPGLTSAQYFYNTPCYWPTFSDTQWRAAVATAEASIYSGDGGRFEHDAEAAGPNHQVFCRGWAPHAMVPLLPKPKMDMAEWFDVTKVGSLDLDILAHASAVAGSTCQVITQQLRR